MIGVTDINAHGQAQKLAHEMILETGTDDLPGIGEVLGADETYDRIHEKWIEMAGDTMCSGFTGELIETSVGLSRQRTALTGLEVHDLLSDEPVTLTMMSKHCLSTLSQCGQ
jgi:hypothetical protein